MRLKTREKFELYKPKKHLGQNFLVDENIARKIVASLSIGSNEPVVEIGPGRGALTKHIARETKDFTAVEYDKKAYDNLSGLYGGNIELICGDFLEYDLSKKFISSGMKLKIIGNIPYNITSKILFRIFDNHEIIQCAVLMMQKEVASRLVAETGTKDYGILSVQTQAYCLPEILFHVSPTSFFPKPKVKSSIVRLNFSNESFINRVPDISIFKDLVRESFGKRRKVMSNSLKDFFESNQLEFGTVDFDFTRRPETVTAEEFSRLATEISGKIQCE